MQHGDQDILPVGGPQDVMVNLVYRALRAEAGVRRKQAVQQSTGYYAGRRAGFVCSAATLATMLFGADYEAAKHAISREVKECGENWTPDDLAEAHKGGELATQIVNAVLLAA